MKNPDLDADFAVAFERFQNSERASRQKKTAQMEEELQRQAQMEEERKREIGRRLLTANETVCRLVENCHGFADHLIKVATTQHSSLYRDNTRLFTELPPLVAEKSRKFSKASRNSGTIYSGIGMLSQEAESISVCHLCESLVTDGESSGRIALVMGIPMTNEFLGKPVIAKTKIILVQCHRCPSVGTIEYSRIHSYLIPGMETIVLALKELGSSIPERVFNFFFKQFGAL